MKYLNWLNLFNPFYLLNGIMEHQKEMDDILARNEKRRIQDEKAHQEYCAYLDKEIEKADKEIEKADKEIEETKEEIKKIKAQTQAKVQKEEKERELKETIVRKLALGEELTKEESDFKKIWDYKKKMAAENKKNGVKDDLLEEYAESQSISSETPISNEIIIDNYSENQAPKREMFDPISRDIMQSSRIARDISLGM